jgi:hypothetical protein
LGAGGGGWGFRAVGACEIFWIMWILHLSRYPFFFLLNYYFGRFLVFLPWFKGSYH